MSESNDATWLQMRFVSPEGRAELLWVEPSDLREASFRVLSVPVWAYDVSVGTIVYGRATADSWLSFESVIEQADGGTVRVIVPHAAPDASALYRSRILEDCQQRRIAIGPATFFDPRLVAIHLQRWEADYAALFEYLDTLIDAGVVQEWEVADPAVPPDEQPEFIPRPSMLVHPRPTPATFYIPDL